MNPRAVCHRYCWLAPRHFCANFGVTTASPFAVRHYSSETPRARHIYSDEPSDDSKPVHQYSHGRRPDRRLYTWGQAKLGALAIRRIVQPERYEKRPLAYLHRPVRVPFAERHRLLDMACGYGFTLLAVRRRRTRSNDSGAGVAGVYGSGLNSDCQLGLHVRRGSGRSQVPLNRLIDPVPVHLPIDSAKMSDGNDATQGESWQVSRVAAGRAHSVIVTDCAGVFTLGNNTYGQCGRPVVPDEQYSSHSLVHRLEWPDCDQDPVVDAVCGQDHTLLLTAAGRVLACGWGADGQTGRGHYDATYELAALGGDIAGERIVKVSCAGDCVLAVSQAGDVFGWGSSEFRQLALVAGDEQQVCQPRRLPVSMRVVDVAAAGAMCALLDAEGGVHVWGLGSLGGGPRLQASERPQRLPAPLFGRNAFSGGDCVPTAVSAGLHHLSVINSNGDLFTWGANRNGELGHGHTEPRLFPQRVSIPARVLRISCGVDHMAALCREFI